MGFLAHIVAIEEVLFRVIRFPAYNVNAAIHNTHSHISHQHNLNLELVQRCMLQREERWDGFPFFCGRKWSWTNVVHAVSLRTSLLKAGSVSRRRQNAKKLSSVQFSTLSCSIKPACRVISICFRFLFYSHIIKGFFTFMNNRPMFEHNTYHDWHEDFRSNTYTWLRMLQQNTVPNQMCSWLTEKGKTWLFLIL